MKALEKKYSKTERIVAKGKFSAWMFLGTAVLAILLGTIVSVLWVFNDQIEGLFTKSEEPAQYLTDEVLRWVLLGCAIVVIVFFVLQAIEYNSREFVLTPDKAVLREGVLGVKTVVIHLNEIKVVETRQSAIQRMIDVGDLIIVSDAQQPYTIKNVVSADRLTRRIMRQVAEVRKESKYGGMRIQLTGSPR